MSESMTVLSEVDFIIFIIIIVHIIAFIHLYPWLEPLILAWCNDNNNNIMMIVLKQQHSYLSLISCSITINRHTYSS